MAFNGYLLKVGDYTIPLEFMAYGTYEASPDQRQDLDAYRDADGYMHRNTLPHTATKIEFQTTYLTASQFRSLIDNIRANFTNLLERKVSLTYYDEETDAYKTGDFYMPGTMTYKRLNKAVYDQNRICFIEY
jgi:hypothetical protein